MENIYTIGHSTNPIEYFIRILHMHKINCIIDVRSTPFSKYAHQYNREELKSTLNKCGIYYIYMGDELGARRKEKNLYSNEGFVDFDEVRKNAVFQKGIKRITEGIKKGYNIALMCTEKDPIACHRCILLGREFHEKGYNVCNITQGGKIQTQIMIEERLLELYFKDRNQITLFSTVENNEKQLINDAYKLKNKEIGYYISGEEGEK